MKKKYFYQLFCCFVFGITFGQTTETFESETVGATSFTDNGRTFSITSQAAGPFAVYELANAGYNGTASDNKFIDNSNSAYPTFPVSFTISSNQASIFTLKSMYLFLSRYDLSTPASGGSLTIVGKKNNSTVFTATANSGFNTNTATNNSYTKIDFTTFGNADNSNAKIDQFVITTTGQIEYVALDAMKWAVACPDISVSVAGQSNVACNGGYNGRASITTPTGGTAPYTYNWTPGNPPGDGTNSVTGLNAGTWTCTVTDANSCSASQSFTITQPAVAINGTPSTTTVSCFGGANGTATITATGGTPGYTYLWSPSGGTAATASGLSAGTYSVTITDSNSCTRIISNIVVSQPAASTLPTLTRGTASQICAGATSFQIAYTATTGSPTTYSISGHGMAAVNNATLLASPLTINLIGPASVGNYTYTMTVKNSTGCTSGNIAPTLAVVSNPTILAGNTTNPTTCGGSNGSIAFTSSNLATGFYSLAYIGAGSPKTVTISSNTFSLTGLNAGSYSNFSLTNNGCTATNNVTKSLSDPALPTLTLGTASQICAGATSFQIAYSATTGSPTTYSLSGPGIIAVTNATLPPSPITINLTGPASVGNYTYSMTIRNAAGCTSGNISPTLAVVASSNNFTNISVCGSYTWANNSTTYITSGIYTGTTTNCVTQKLNLTITPSSDNVTTVAACDSYLWKGTTYSASGIYVGTTTNCITEKLNLTITPSSENVSTVFACFSYTWNGTTYATTGIYTGVTTNCVTQKLNLTITPSSENVTTISTCNSYVWNGTTYATSGIYTGTTSNCVTQKLNLTINTIPIVTGNANQNFNSTDTLANVIVSPTNVVWYASLANALAGTSPLLASQVLTNNTIYFSVSTLNGCSSTPFEVNVSTTLTNSDFDFTTMLQVYPNPFIDVLTVSINANATIEIYDLIGKSIKKQNVNNGTSEIDLSDASKGVYLFKVTSDNGAIKTIKIIKR